jgi:hypothetical protein
MLALTVTALAAGELTVDFSRTNGVIRPLHGVNLGPLCYRGMVDMANCATAEIQMFGLFNLNGVPQKTYYAFKAFRDLLDTPRRVATPPCTAGQVAACAGLNAANTRAAVLLSSFHPAEHPTEVTVRQLPWTGPTEFELYVVDAGRDHQLARRGTLGPDGRLVLSELNSPFVALLTLFPPPSAPHE